MAPADAGRPGGEHPSYFLGRAGDDLMVTVGPEDFRRTSGGLPEDFRRTSAGPPQDLRGRGILD